MSEQLPFCQVKVQYLTEIAANPTLDDNAVRVILYLALHHADHVTGEARPTFKTIGLAVGKHEKSVKRAVNKAVAAGYLDIERGTNIGNASRYRPTKEAFNRARERRKETDKIVPLSSHKRGQKRPQRGALPSLKAGQVCPPNLDQELKKEHGPHQWVVVLASSMAARTWEDLFDRHIGQRINELVHEVTSVSGRGYLLPAAWPPIDRSAWPEMAALIVASYKQEVARVGNE